MAKCQVCDGPVVNGRCKLCGMPYRKDEVLYHLNESRSEHYKHATPKARAQMRANQIPEAGRKGKSAGKTAAGQKSGSAGAGRSAYGGTAAGKTTYGSTGAGRTAYGGTAAGRTAYGEPATGRTAYGGTAGGRAAGRNAGNSTDNRRTARTVRGTAAAAQSASAGKKSTAQEILDKRVQERRKSYDSGEMQKSANKRSKFSIILALVLLAVGVLPGIINTAKEKYETDGAARHGESWREGDALVNTEELLLMAFLDVDNPEIVVTETYGEGKIMPGEYVITIPEDGYVEILVQYAENGNSEKFIFEDKDDQTVLRLSKGDSVTLTGYANKTRYALFYLIEQYDESTPM